MNDVPEALLREIVETYNPQRVILFGSRARGDARPDSDWDLAVVLDDDAPTTLPRGGLLRDLHVMPLRLSWFRDRAHIRGAFAATILREGRSVYEREDAAPMTPSGSAEHTPATEAATWLKRVDQDLELARYSVRRDPPLNGPAAFHLQQAAEKLLKALLILADREVPKTHKLDDLLARLGPDAKIDAATAALLPGLSDWAFAGRYPDGPEEPDAATLAATLPVVASLREHVAARIAAA